MLVCTRPTGSMCKSMHKYVNCVCTHTQKYMSVYFGQLFLLGSTFGDAVTLVRFWCSTTVWLNRCAMACMHVCSHLVSNRSVCVCVRQGPIGYETLSEFPYAAAVVNEALRLYPPGPTLSRISQKDTKASLFFYRYCHKIAEYVPHSEL